MWNGYAHPKMPILQFLWHWAKYDLTKRDGFTAGSKASKSSLKRSALLVS